VEVAYDMAAKPLRREVENLDELSVGRLTEKIRTLEAKYGVRYDEFAANLNEDEATYEELIDEFNWGCYADTLSHRLTGTKEYRISVGDFDKVTEVFSPLRMATLRTLAKLGKATASEVAAELGKPLGSVVTALNVLERHGLAKRVEEEGEKRYVSQIAKIVISV